MLADPRTNPERLATLDEMAREAHEMAGRTGKTEERTVAAVLRARIAARRGEADAGAASLQSLLSAATTGDRARIFHALFDITKDECYRAQALAAYDELTTARPDAAMRRQAEMLRRAANGTAPPRGALPRTV